MPFLDHFRLPVNSVDTPYGYTSEAGRARRNGVYTSLTTTESKHKSSASADLVETSEKVTLKMGAEERPQVASTSAPTEQKPRRRKSVDDPCAGFDTRPANLNGKISLGGHAAAGGGFANIYRGILEEKGVRKTVAVKIIRKVEGKDEERINKRIRREVDAWATLKHKNVLQLLGITSDFPPFISMVCPWVSGGTLSNYIRSNAPPLAVRLRLLTEVAEGLAYLHSKNVVHGDLTPTNILIDCGHVKLCDFGLSRIKRKFGDGQSELTSSMGQGGNVRWGAPELYRVDGPRKVSYSSDIYSFASVMYEVLSGSTPFHGMRDSVVLMAVIHRQAHPSRPSDKSSLINDHHWEFMIRCWSSKRKERPSAEDVLRDVTAFYRQS